MRTWMTLSALLVSVVSASSHAQDTGSDTSALRADFWNEDPQIAAQARSAWIGPVIGSGPGFTVHSPVAALSGGRVTCSAGAAGPVLSEAERFQRDEELYEWKQAQREAMFAEETRRRKPYDDEWMAVRDRYHAGQISSEESAAAWPPIEAALEEITAWRRSEETRIEEEFQRRRRGEIRSLSLIVQHTPESPNATIVPMDGARPTGSFVAEINRIAAPVLDACGPFENISSQHFYADAYRPYGGERERAVYTIIYDTTASGALTLEPEREALNLPGLEFLPNRSDPRENPELTLSGFREALAQRPRDPSYRAAFESASARIPGVVYKGDAFWDVVNVMDVVRRIFDGDFRGFDDTIEFKAFFMALNDVYIGHCRANVPDVTVYELSGQEYAGSSYNLDGSVTRFVRDSMTEIPVDTRFTPHWSNYRLDVNAYLFSNVLKMPAIDLRRMSTSDFREAIAATTEMALLEHFSMQRFIRAEGCDSPALDQLVQNFVRAANGQPSTQEAGIAIANAQRASDPPSRP